MATSERSMLGQVIRHTGKRKRIVDPLLDDIKYQPSQAELEALPDPTPLLQVLATSVVEVITGARSVDQISALVSDQVYEKLRARSVVRAQVDATSGRPKLAPKFAVRKVHAESPRLGIVESVVLLSSAARTRAVTIRLEPINKKWRATDVSVL